MTQTTLARDAERVCRDVRDRMRAGDRTVVGIAGPPASGKSALAQLVVDQLNNNTPVRPPFATLLPMDGYHLDNGLLESRGLLSRKGAPETFDANGFCDAVANLCVSRRETYHPKFDREFDLSIANSIAIHPDTPVVVIEGNYLLLNSDPWSKLNEVFALTVFVRPTLEELKKRLLHRWTKYGLDEEAALRRAESNDLVNAQLILRNSIRADIELTQSFNEFGD